MEYAVVDLGMLALVFVLALLHTWRPRVPWKTLLPFLTDLGRSSAVTTILCVLLALFTPPQTCQSSCKGATNEISSLSSGAFRSAPVTLSQSAHVDQTTERMFSSPATWSASLAHVQAPGEGNPRP